MSAKAKLLFNRGAGQPVECLVRFSERDEIAACEASRYFSATELRLWVTHFSDYRRQQSLLVPFVGEASWVIAGQRQPCAQFVVQELDYAPHRAFLG